MTDTDRYLRTIDRSLRMIADSIKPLGEYLNMQVEYKSIIDSDDENTDEEDGEQHGREIRTNFN